MTMTNYKEKCYVILLSTQLVNKKEKCVILTFPITLPFFYLRLHRPTDTTISWKSSRMIIIHSIFLSVCLPKSDLVFFLIFIYTNQSNARPGFDVNSTL